MKHDIELKQCPFCNSKATVEDDAVMYIKCTGCGIELYDKDFDRLVELWNSRPREDAAYKIGNKDSEIRYLKAKLRAETVEC